MKIGKYKLSGGGICPEQYDVFDASGKEVGCLRMRHGNFTAYLTIGVANMDWKLVYASDEAQGDGCFYDDERERFLTAGINAINKALSEQPTQKK